ncbi:MAG: hypothetical protein M0002_14710 [Rhodospirillales bacterium]|nr:hypothetical protein [Rhodospirillales bacterium]
MGNGQIAADLWKKRDCLLGLVEAIQKMEPTPLPFLCAAAMIEYLSKLAGGGDYVAFIKDKFPPRYRNFQYGSRCADLPEQMKQIMRNGLVHNFSLFPDRNKGGRKRSIVLTHRGNQEGPHLKLVSRLDCKDEAGGEKIDAALFVLEDFCDDIKCVIKKIVDAAANERLREKIESRWKEFPPVAWLGKAS